MDPSTNRYYGALRPSVTADAGGRDYGRESVSPFNCRSRARFELTIFPGASIKCYRVSVLDDRPKPKKGLPAVRYRRAQRHQLHDLRRPTACRLGTVPIMQLIAEILKEFQNPMAWVLRRLLDDNTGGDS